MLARRACAGRIVTWLPLTDGEPVAWATAAPAESSSRTVSAVTLAGSIGSLKLIEGWTLDATSVAPGAGELPATVGASLVWGARTSSPCSRVPKTCGWMLGSSHETSTFWTVSADQPGWASAAASTRTRSWPQASWKTSRTCSPGCEKTTAAPGWRASPGTPGSKLTPVTVSSAVSPGRIERGCVAVTTGRGQPMTRLLDSVLSRPPPS